MGLLMSNGKAVETYSCPVCKFPLNYHFVEQGFDRKVIELHVGCSKCCWMENWGTYTPKEVENRVRLEPRTGTAAASNAA